MCTAVLMTSPVNESAVVRGFIEVSEIIKSCDLCRLVAHTEGWQAAPHYHVGTDYLAVPIHHLLTFCYAAIR